MDIVHSAVGKLREMTRGCGYEDGNIVLSVNPDRKVCQFEKGACMEVSFGGRIAEFVTFEPTRGTTRLPFLFSAALEKPAHRAAACAIINVLTGFMCISRARRSCNPGCHAACMADLRARIGEKAVGGLEIPGHVLRSFPRHTDSPGGGDVVLVGGEGLLSPEFGSLLEEGGPEKILLVGPSTSGIACLESLPHWCPYGEG
ncbi:MAG: hypothetical protein NQU46_01635 [Methanolinea sp.]|nr:hypothetical protein [Methanolinea sp.]